MACSYPQKHSWWASLTMDTVTLLGTRKFDFIGAARECLGVPGVRDADHAQRVVREWVRKRDGTPGSVKQEGVDTAVGAEAKEEQEEQGKEGQETTEPERRCLTWTNEGHCTSWTDASDTAHGGQQVRMMVL